MKDIALRFSHLSEKIFDHLTNEDIVKYREVDRFWKNYLDNRKFFQVRKMRAIVSQFHKIEDGGS